jgi:single-stranded-DNA-specific exonuclease
MQRIVKAKAEADPDVFNEKLYIEKELSADEKNIGFAESLKLLEPYGEGNPVPVFCMIGASVSSVRTMGAEEQHIRFTACTQDKQPVGCVLFGRADMYKDIIFGQDMIDVAGELDINEFRGERKLQMRIRDIRRSERDK